MISVDIATAALNDTIEQRVRIAASVLPAFHIRAKVRAWDGTRCGVLVTDIFDAYGRQAYALAVKRNTPVLLIGEPHGQTLPGALSTSPNSPAPVIAQLLREMLGSNTKGDKDPDEIVVGGRQSALCRLIEPEFSGHPVDATYNGRAIHIRPGEGRVYAPTFSDLLSARDSFSIADWQLSVPNESDVSYRNDGASKSLEAFLLQSAFHGRSQLPAFPDGRYQLTEWPDVGSAPELIGALKAAKALLRGPASANELHVACRVDPQEINACLWAYRAANLLVSSSENIEVRPPPRQVGAFSGMLSRIASRFGLSMD